MSFNSIKYFCLWSIFLFFTLPAVAADWLDSTNAACKVWNTSPNSNVSVTWDGSCPDGIANGRGEIQWFENGNLIRRYNGNVKSGKYHGLGVLSFASGIRYEGTFREGSFHGVMKEILPKPVFEVMKSKPRYAAFLKDGEGEWINDEFVVTIVRVENESLLCGKNLNKDADCPALVTLLELTVDHKKKEARKVQELKENSLRCLNAVVPESTWQKNSNSEFYGNCSPENSARDGLVVWKSRGVPVDIECLSNGAYTNSADITSFKACEKYWVLLPGFCKKDDYSGQCQEGKPQGVGFMTGQRGGTRVDFGGGAVGSVLNAFAAAGPKLNYSIYIERGMFSDGKLNGFGRALSLSGCGQAGCSGSRVNDTGWFKQGEKQFDCNSYAECLPKLSGKDLAEQRRNWMPTVSENQDNFINANTFEGAMDAFVRGGKREDLKRAQSLAKSEEQKRELEFHLLQTVGFERIFHLAAHIKNGSTSVDAENSEKVLGLFRAINSSVPLEMSWNITHDKSTLPLIHGSYAVQLKIGMKVSKTVRACFGTGCTDRVDIQPYIKTVDVVLRPATGYLAKGNFEMTVSGASHSTVLGAESGSVISAVEPVISIESVRPLP